MYTSGIFSNLFLLPFFSLPLSPLILPSPTLQEFLTGQCFHGGLAACACVSVLAHPYVLSVGVFLSIHV